jgi:glycosyltransferase involved in cell wall biosynthesis
MRCKFPISVFIITFNEERNIGAALNRVIEFDEVIIVDSGSTDKTLQIAQTYPNVSTYYNKFLGFSEQKSLALSLCKNDWVLNIDADELLTQGYIEAVEFLMNEGKFDALESTRTLLRWGKVPRHFSKPDRLIRFFKKESGKYEKRRVHESISIVGNVGKTSETILHCENLTLTERVEKSNRYSELRALDKCESGTQASLLSVLLSFPITFLRLYFFKGHCLDGVSGYMTSMNASFYAFLKYAKLWEFRQQEKPNQKPDFSEHHHISKAR